MLALPRRPPGGGAFNMATLLVDRHVEEGRGHRPALRLEEGDLSYRELQALVNRAGNALRALGVAPEQRVALLVPDGPEFVAAFIGAMKIGAVPVPLNTAARADEIVHMLTDSRAHTLVADAALSHDLRHGVAHALIVGGEGDSTISFSSALASASDELHPYPTRPDEPCYWLYSSGTTGRAKGVVHLHGDMLACVTPYAEDVLDIESTDVVFSVARLFFSYGLVNSLFLPLLAGASAVLTPQRPDADHVLHIMRRFRPTVLFSVPTSYAQLCQVDDASAFTCLRLAISAGEPLPEPLYRRWCARTSVEILDGLGSTEVGYIFCSNRPGHVRPGSSGVMLADHAARIVDETGADAPDGTSGELWVRARSTALYYWNQRERTKQTFVGDWLRTGDRYVRDSDGYLWYQGRTNDVFKVSGQWVSPLDIESCLLDHPAVAECAVVGLPDGAGLVKPKAFVVCRDAQTTELALQAWVKDRLQPHNYPRWVEFVPSLPKTASGKVQRFRLRGDDEAWERQ